MKDSQRFQLTQIMYEKAKARQELYGKIVEDVTIPISFNQGMELYFPESLWKKRIEQKSRNTFNESWRTASMKNFNTQDVHASFMKEDNIYNESSNEINNRHLIHSSTEKSANINNLKNTFLTEISQNNSSSEKTNTSKLFNEEIYDEDTKSDVLGLNSIQNNSEYFPIDIVHENNKMIENIEVHSENSENSKNSVESGIPIDLFSKFNDSLNKKNITLRKKKKNNTNNDNPLKIILSNPEFIRTRPTEFVYSKKFKPLETIKNEKTIPLRIGERFKIIESEKINKQVNQLEYMLQKNEKIGELISNEELPDPRKFEELAGTIRDDVFQRAMNLTKNFSKKKPLKNISKRFSPNLFAHYAQIPLNDDLEPTFSKEQTIAM